ncbi:hypothetical protein D6D25_04892 [Aureobasidium pullulans]|nr:hypothetical protein D6D25_04892 [Aureobasidium pullulans]
MSEEIAEKNESEEEVSENDRSEEEVDEDDDVENVSEPDATEVDVLDTEATSDQEAHHFGVKNPILINFQGYTLTMGLLNTIKAKAINKEDKVRRLSSNRPSEWNHGGDKEEYVRDPRIRRICRMSRCVQKLHRHICRSSEPESMP